MTFETYIEKAIIEIKNSNLSQTYEYIHIAMAQDDSSPKPHNLLGIIAELSGDLNLAGKHYRAAYALDPTFKATYRNLERITKFYYRLDIKNIDFGDTAELDKESPYIIKYDSNNIGHLVKNNL